MNSYFDYTDDIMDIVLNAQPLYKYIININVYYNEKKIIKLIQLYFNEIQIIFFKVLFKKTSN